MTKYAVFAAGIAAVVYHASPASAQQNKEPFPTGFFVGVVGQKVELQLSDGNYDAGELDNEDPTYGLRFGGRFNTGANIVVDAKLGVDVPQGTYKSRQVYCTPADGCNATYSLEREDGISWSANANLGVGFQVDNWLFSVSGGAEIAEVFRREQDFRNLMLESTWEGSDYAFGPRVTVGAEYSVGNGLSARVDYVWRDLEYDHYAFSRPGDQTYRDNNAVAGSAIEFGVFYNF